MHSILPVTAKSHTSLDFVIKLHDSLCSYNYTYFLTRLPEITRDYYRLLEITRDY